VGQGQHGGMKEQSAGQFRNCVSCHDPHTVIKAADRNARHVVDGKPPMEQCGACHAARKELPKRSADDAKCWSCHEGGAVSRERAAALCLHCHGEGTSDAQIATGRVRLPVPTNTAAYKRSPHSGLAWKEGERGLRDNFPVLVRSMTAAAVPFARSGFRVLIDFSIPPAYVDTARKILKEVPFDFVLLQPSLQVCVERAASREKGAITEYARSKNFYEFFEDGRTEPICDDNADPASLARRIAEGLNQGRFRVV
jgi:hypothetical protein